MAAANAKAEYVVHKPFHGYRDADIYPPYGAGLNVKYRIFQRRDLGYRFYPHFHPYAGRLAQRVLQRSIAGLQAADTEYDAPNLSVADSVQVAIAVNKVLGLAAGARVTLVNATPLGLSHGAATKTLAANSSVALTNALDAVLTTAVRATLSGERSDAPLSGTSFTIAADAAAVLDNDAVLSIPVDTQLTLLDGSTLFTPANAKTAIVIRAGRPVTIRKTDIDLLQRKRRPTADWYAQLFSKTSYNPSDAVVKHPYPVKDLDFTSSGPYSAYNWELFFHVPLTIAVNLSKNQRFVEAQQWFHYIFDPTDDSDGPTPERFWKVRPFQYTDVKQVELLLVNLATGADPALRDDTVHSIEAWQEAPFRPHVVARIRQQAYMYKTVMAYLDNLIEWGDSLFRQDTGETIDEAMMVYVLAANILGPRPLPIPEKGKVRPQTYNNLRNDLQLFGTVLRDLEPDLPFDLMPFPASSANASGGLPTLRSMGKALYFCVPRNDRLLQYWDTVADRLFKIRNSLNFQGVFRQLALFDPPIDPGMLARAAAAGLDVGAIVNGLNQPLPLVRFQLLAQKAVEIVQEVKTLGGNLLSAMEKEDGEAMAILRARHERVIMQMVEQVKYGQWQEAIKAKEGLFKSLALGVERYSFYERQLGRTPDEIKQGIPEIDDLDRDAMESFKFNMKEPEVTGRQIDVDIATGILADAARVLSGGKILSSNEVAESMLLEVSQLANEGAAVTSMIASILALIPQFEVNLKPWGLGGGVVIGGQHFSTATQTMASIARMVGERASFEARRASRIDSFARREREWAFQSNLAAGEITQVYKQLRAAQIRQAVAEMELKSHRKQMQHAEEIEHFLNEEGAEKNGKKTNRALYAWMKREVKGLYAQAFQFAFDTARKAERALQHELGKPDLSFLQFGYLAGKEGLLAGEKLFLDVKRMEAAYHDLNQREYELTKHVSLLQVDPLALIQLRATGRCTVRLPESLFDMDGPGHYFRRIKNVAVSIPCVTGPYASVNCTLTLRKSGIRTTPVLRGNTYVRETDDDRFSDFFGSMQSIVTSSAQNDTGLFETNLRDERYLPFENSGVESEWQIELPANPANADPLQFDYNTISDVLMHIRFTAREGGALLRNAALKSLTELIEAGDAAGSNRVFSARHEFPSEWARFQAQPTVAGKKFGLAITLRKEHYPFWSLDRLAKVRRIDLIARSSANPVADITLFGKDDGSGGTGVLTSGTNTFGKFVCGALTGAAAQPPLPANPVGDLNFHFDSKSMADLWIGITFGK